MYLVLSYCKLHKIIREVVSRSSGLVPEVWFPAAMNDSTSTILHNSSGMLPPDG